MARQTVVVGDRGRRHDARHRARRHRSLGRLGRRARPRSWSRALLQAGLGPSARRSVGVAVGAPCGLVNGALVAALRDHAVHRHARHDERPRAAWPRGWPDEQKIDADPRGLDELMASCRTSARSCCFPAASGSRSASRCWRRVALGLHALRAARGRDRLERADGAPVRRAASTRVDDARSTRSRALSPASPA